MRRLRVFLFALVAICTVVSVPAIAQDWGVIANISSTMGVSGSRVCIGEASRGDIGCPAYAPTVSATGAMGITAGLTVNAVSLTTGGTTWGYLGSAASYLPNLNSNNISVTTINGVSVSALGGGASPTNVPAFRAYRAGNQTITAATWVKILLDTKSFDNFSNFNTSTSRFTAPMTGVYLLNANSYCGSSASQCGIQFYINGVASLYTNSIQAGAPNASNIVKLNADDYVEVYVYSGSSTTLTGGSAYTNFSASLMASGNGLISGTGASALSGLSDVTLSAPASGQVLSYNGTSWVNTTISATASASGTTSAMKPNWPDAIYCSGTSGGMYLYLSTNYASDGRILYRNTADDYYVFFTSSGAFSSYTQAVYNASCNNVSISQHYAAGTAFNFTGSAGGGALGDRITSGTTSVIAKTTNTVEVSGTLKFTGTQANVCDSAQVNALKVVNGRVFVCR